MGKITGFLEYERLAEASEPVPSRLKHYREFVMRLDDKAASVQGARCMDCGIPFCQTGCPVNNIIPDWNDLVYRGNWLRAIDTLHSTNNFPEFTGRVCPAPCESACTLNIHKLPAMINSLSRETVLAADLEKEFDAVVLAGGAEMPRDLPIPGRELNGIHFAMSFLPLQNRVVAGDKVKDQILATGKHVVVIGGGDTGSDCVGTSNRQGALSVTQFELLAQPPVEENRPMTWPYWPIKLRTSSSHEEGVKRDWAVTTKRFNDDGKGNVASLTCARVQWQKDERSGQMKMVEVEGSEFEVKADLVLFAMGFVSPVASVLEAFGVERDVRGNARATTEGEGSYRCSEKIFAAGDMRRGQSLVVWAIREGRQAARSVDQFLMGTSELPR